MQSYSHSKHGDLSITVTCQYSVAIQGDNKNRRKLKDITLKLLIILGAQRCLLTASKTAFFSLEDVGNDHSLSQSKAETIFHVFVNYFHSIFVISCNFLVDFSPLCIGVVCSQ